MQQRGDMLSSEDMFLRVKDTLLLCAKNVRKISHMYTILKACAVTTSTCFTTFNVFGKTM